MENFKSFIILILIIVVLSHAKTQIIWKKTYGKNDKTEIASKIIETSSHRFIVVGSTCDTALLSYLWGWDGYIMCINSVGDTLWTKVIGSSANDFINDVIETVPHEFIICGMGYKASANSQQVWLIKLQLNVSEDQILNIEQKHYGKSGKKDGANKIIKNQDGTYIVVGFTEGYGTQQGGSDAWLLKLNAQLDTMWTKTYDMGFEESARSIIPLNDDTYLLLITSTTGLINNFPIPPYYCSFSTVLHIDENGNILKSLTFDSDTINFLSHGVNTPDGGVILIGGTGMKDNSYSGGGRNLYLVKLNSDLDTMWTKIYGKYGKYDAGFDVMNWHDGGFLALGYTQSFYTDSVDNWWLLRLDSNGDTLFSNVLIHRKKNDDPCNIILSSDGKLIIAGWIDANSNAFESSSIGNSSICLMAIDSAYVMSSPSLKRQFFVFPNPFHEFTHISLPYELNNATLFIYDLTGKLILKKPYTGNPILQLNSVKPGTYILNIQTPLIVLSTLIEVF
ncbi:MAG: T9SS type A sorting domain-containing protein [Bacteroidales bacterium]|nr:T9SS type A sorting domain-containing protein [Bacteroidales bacterium]